MPRVPRTQAPDRKTATAIPLTLAALLVAAVLTAGCLSDTDGDDGPVPRTYTFDFSKGAQGWTGNIAHYVVGDEANLEFVHDVRPLPANLGGGDALYVSSKNTPDDLFVYFVRQLDGLVPGAQYRVAFNMTIASHDAEGGPGIGGSPGDSVHVRAGAANVSFTRFVGNDTRYKISPDVGDSLNEGEHGVHLGSIGKPDDGTADYALKTLDSSAATLLVTADDEGRAWALFGTDSGYEGLTTMYYTHVSVSLEPYTM